ncbi:MAG: DNA polymerase III subunit gamma/tau C-terminal domain-containing protein, partial [Burkholderiaceae bacterium]
QKVPVTVLSRCLQFNLKQMTPVAIAERMGEILTAEQISAEPAALRTLAHAARGSMRDGLSLLDQAIAYSGGSVTLDAVRAMLGAVDQGTLVLVLDAIAARDAKRALAIADEMNEHSVSFAQALRDLASMLHRIALIQQVEVAADDAEGAEELKRLAATFAGDEVQLFYQIALHGRDEMDLAPDEYAGFTMALMRMLAFAPAGSPAAAVPAERADTATRSVPKSAPVTSTFDGNWPALVARLKVSGLVRELAQRSELTSFDNDRLKLRVPLRTLLDAGALQKLQAAVSDALGRPMRVAAEVGSTVGPTSAGIAEQQRAERQRQAEESIYADPFVRELIENFGASVDPTSIRPRTDNDTEKTS